MIHPERADGVTGVELRNTIQRCSNNAAAGAEEMRMEAFQGHNVQSDSIISEHHGGDGIERNDTTRIRLTVANIKKEAESPGPRDVRPITAYSHTLSAHGRTRDTEKR